MKPWELRDLPKHRQVELMAHRREVSLRENHASHVQREVAKRDADAGTTGKRKR